MGLGEEREERRNEDGLQWLDNVFISNPMTPNDESKLHNAKYSLFMEVYCSVS